MDPWMASNLAVTMVDRLVKETESRTGTRKENVTARKTGWLMDSLMECLMEQSSALKSVGYSAKKRVYEKDWLLECPKGKWTGMQLGGGLVNPKEW